MKFLFAHRNFPAQFRHILLELTKDSENEIYFITNANNNVVIPGVKKVVYKPKREVPENCHRYLRTCELSVIHGQSTAECAIMLRNQGFIPDVIYAHSWGSPMFFKDIYPDVPLLNFCEWYYNAKGSEFDFDTPNIDENARAMIRCQNAPLLIDLVECDMGITRTEWQKKQMPKEFHDKIKVLHDGIDTDFFVPNENAELYIPDKKITLTKKDKVITYATRGMEAFRGFPQFMEMAERILKQCPDVHIVIAGQDRICYGPPPVKGTSYKEMMLEKLDLDMNRVHFTGGLPYGEYIKLLQISSAHVYLTYPFVLSWSVLEAMSCECCVIGSKTAPVEEVIKDGENGILTDFFDVEKLTEKVNYVLDNQDKINKIRQNARKTIVDKYDLKKLLPEHIQLLKNMAN